MCNNAYVISVQRQSVQQYHRRHTSYEGWYIVSIDGGSRPIPVERQFCECKASVFDKLHNDLYYVLVGQESEQLVGKATVPESVIS